MGAGSMGLPSGLVARAALSPLVGPEPGAWKPAASPVPPAVGGWGSNAALSGAAARARAADTAAHNEQGGFTVKGQCAVLLRAGAPEAGSPEQPAAAVLAGLADETAAAALQPAMGALAPSAAAGVPSAMGTRRAAKARGVDSDTARVSQCAMVPLAALDSSSLSLGKAFASLDRGQLPPTALERVPRNVSVQPAKANGLRGSGGRVPSPAARLRASRGYSQGARAAARSLPLAGSSTGGRSPVPSLFVSGSRGALLGADDEDKGTGAGRPPPSGWPRRAAKPSSPWSRGELVVGRDSVVGGASVGGASFGASLVSESLAEPFCASVGLDAGSDANFHGKGTASRGGQVLRTCESADRGSAWRSAGAKESKDAEQVWAPVPKPGLAALGISPVGHDGAIEGYSERHLNLERGVSRSRLPVATPNAWGAESPTLDGLLPEGQSAHLLA